MSQHTDNLKAGLSQTGSAVAGLTNDATKATRKTLSRWLKVASDFVQPKEKNNGHQQQ